MNHNTREDYFIAVSRLVPYKRVDLIVETFNNRPDLKLKVIGTGPQMREIRAKAGKNIEILGYVDDNVLLSELQNARAFVFAAIEDFGIAPLEAQSCGTPVIALGHGGTAETVVDYKSKNTRGATGVHFQEQTTSSLSKALDEFLAIEKDLCIEYISEFAEGFSRANFRQNFTNLINQTMNDQDRI